MEFLALAVHRFLEVIRERDNLEAVVLEGHFADIVRSTAAADETPAGERVRSEFMGWSADFLLFPRRAAIVTRSYETVFRHPVSSMSFRGRGLEGGSYPQAKAGGSQQMWNECRRGGVREDDAGVVVKAHGQGLSFGCVVVGDPLAHVSGAR